MLISPAKRKFLKISAYTFGTLIVLFLGFHFWFINHAEQLLEDLVASKSNGKLKLKVKKFKFDYLNNNMQLRHAVFYSTDSVAAGTGYRFGVEKINITLKELLPLILEKKLLIDSLSLTNPDIEVTRLHSTKRADTSNLKEVSLPHEMGKIYNSIQDALKLLQVNRFQITDGRFTLINRIKKEQLPVTITHINFHLDNLQVDSSSETGRTKILFSDNVALNTHDQDILFADGRHRLSFSRFHINILDKMVLFDSCTISAIKGDSTRTSFSVFFDKLRLTNIDFDTLYQKEVIKADSVYCVNPQFRLDVELDKKGGKKQAPPRLDELIQQLTGDLRLAFVVVSNSSFDITTMREGRPSSFTSDHNNFEMQGLSIEKNAPRHVSVKSFAMAIRNYENFLRDSTYVMQFDSILFINNSVYLSNFSFRQMDGETVVNSFSMPQFVLKGLSWDDLVFEGNLAADRATLYRPIINYSVLKKQKQDIFQTLAGIGKIIQLENLDMTHGQINVHFKGGTQLKLENADMSLLSGQLLKSRRAQGLQRSVRQLRFEKGSLKTKDISMDMQNVNFFGETGKLVAGSVKVTSKEKHLLINARNVAINRMMIDDNSNLSEIDGVKWEQAEIKVAGLPPNKGNTGKKIMITNIAGNNTKLSISSNGQELGAFLETVSADKFSLKVPGKPQIINLQTTGNNFSFSNTNSTLKIDKFAFADHRHSEMQAIFFKKSTPADSITITVPSAGFEADLNSIINNKISADKVSLVKPTIEIKQIRHGVAAVNQPANLPGVSIGALSIRQPEILLARSGDDTFRVEWHGKDQVNNGIELAGFNFNKDPEQIRADEFSLVVNNLSVTAGNKTIETGRGSIRTRIRGFNLEPSTTNEWTWNGLLAELDVKDLSFDNIGKHAGRLEISSARLTDLAIRSASFMNPRQTIKENKAFRLHELSGQFNNTINHFDWNNLSYDKTSKILSLDSFGYHPIAERDSFIANHQYQVDYSTVRTGQISAGPFDIDRYLTDTVIDAGTVNMSDIFVTIYRDKRKPEKGNIIKPLPVNLLKKIPVHLSVDTAYLNQTSVEYTEVNEKTNLPGVVSVNRIQGKMFPVTNYRISGHDSLELQAKGRLLDTIGIALNLKESYTDSLAGFLLSADMKPANAKVLNPVLIPMVSAKLESGFLDTLTMRVKGNEFVAIGAMQMYYHDLKVKLLDKGVDRK
ncbi:MAG TPA: hypothetical protein VFI06_11380, partial [Chitinophagaceae bacterium]|nr:hypothetical protein [Chitinophagaceae bacterium]